MRDDTIKRQLENITDFVMFEAETSIIWPWAIPAEEMLQRRDDLLAAAKAVHLDAEGYCDTDEMYEALEQVFGTNPVLAEEHQPEGGMVPPGM